VDLDLSWYSIYNDCLGNRSADLHDTGMRDGKVRDNRNFRQKRAHAARPSAPFELPCSKNHIYDLDASSDRVSTLSVGVTGPGSGADLTGPNMPEHVPQ
jgi:hypothetical protein